MSASDSDDDMNDEPRKKSSRGVKVTISMIKDWTRRFKVGLFVLRFYSKVNPLGSCRAQSVYLTGCLLGRLSPLSGLPVFCTFFCQKLTTVLLESAEWRKYFKINLHERKLPTWQGSNPQPPDHQLDVHPTEPRRSARFNFCIGNIFAQNCFVLYEIS